MVGFIATVYTRMAEARLAKTQKKIERQGGATVQDMVTAGKEKARVLVPKGTTGWLYGSIKGRVEETSDGTRGIIFLEPYIVPNDGIHRGANPKGKYTNFSLSRWSHTSPRAKSWFHKGEADFMYQTRDYLNSKKKGMAKGRFKTIKL